MDLGGDMERFQDEDLWADLHELLKEEGIEVVTGTSDPPSVTEIRDEPAAHPPPELKGHLDEDLWSELLQLLKEEGGAVVDGALGRPSVDELGAEPTVPVVLPQPDHGQSGGYGEWLNKGAPHQGFVHQTPQMVAPISWQPTQTFTQAGLFSQGQCLHVPERRFFCNLQPVGALNGELVYLLGPAAPPPINTFHSRACRKWKYEDQPKDGKPYIKKPPNAFMLFLKEQRSVVSAEIGVRESVIVNAEVGRRWKSLPKDEQEKYYQQARAAAQHHRERHPGWSATDNYRKSKARKRAAGAKGSKYAGSTEMPQLLVPMLRPSSTWD